jgi:hypothetical protein
LFTVLLTLAFSLAVCALIGVGVTTGFDRVIEYVREVRERAATAARKANEPAPPVADSSSDSAA